MRGPNHREDLMADLYSVGLVKPRIMVEQPTPVTHRTITGIYQLIAYDEQKYDIKSLSALRLWGEVLTAEEYIVILAELGRRYGLTPEQSVFYAPHIGHDRTQVLLGSGGTTHADRLGKIIARLVENEPTYAIAQRAFDASYDLKKEFYDQFLV